MADYADLEIRLSRRDEDVYEIDLSFTQPDSDADTRLIKETPRMQLKVKSMRPYLLNPEQYGHQLTAQLFGDPKVREAFKSARREAETHKVPLRVRLAIDYNAAALHGLRWETLRDPEDHSRTLLTSENCLFSRYLSADDFQRIEPRTKSALKALVVIADPADLDPTQLAPVKVADELERAKAGLGTISITSLASKGQASLNRMQQSLRQGCDILYLVCHGAMETDDETEEPVPRLWLEDAAGKADVVDGRELVNHLKELKERPLLVVLASCQSAGQGQAARSNDEGALAGLGPRLAEAGIPAAAAMQGNISMKTVEQFMPVFFQELRRHGQIDRAMAVARGQIRDRPDWWMPVLFMRLKSGQLYRPVTFDLLPFEPKTVPIPQGKFWMGGEPDDKGAAGDEPAGHQVDLPAYRIGEYPVTNAEYEIFIQKSDAEIQPPPSWHGLKPLRGEENRPVRGVTWYDALAYCQWLSQATERRYTLPNEAQWEKAARSSNCFDMIGNPPEWTRTLWGVRSSEPDPEYSSPWEDDGRRDDLEAGDHLYRVARGGAAGSGPDQFKVTTRMGFDPKRKGLPKRGHGFRVVLNLES